MNNSHNGLRSAAVIALCGLFAVLAMGLALLSSGVYRAAAGAADENFHRRTALSYLVNQVRRADEDGCVAVGTFGGSDALALTEHIGGSDYVTYLYCWDGALRELYQEAGTGLLPGDGVPILELEGLDIGSDGGVLTLTVTAPGGETAAVSLSPRCGFEKVGAL